MTRHLNARGLGEYVYDFVHDVMTFRVKDRDYKKSVDFDNLVIDFDTEDYITGLRVFDASKIFKLSKVQLKNVGEFEFNASVEDNIISLQLKFTSTLRNMAKVVQGQDFIREAVDAIINDSAVTCTVA